MPDNDIRAALRAWLAAPGDDLITSDVLASAATEWLDAPPAKPPLDMERLEKAVFAPYEDEHDGSAQCRVCGEDGVRPPIQYADDIAEAYDRG